MTDRFQKESVDVIFSCLPLGSFDPALTSEILRKAQYVLKSGGYFIQFQYFLQNKKDVEKYFEIQKIKWEIRNIPPAFVYIAEKK
jgi:phospholipid N-methyltransferase